MSDSACPVASRAAPLRPLFRWAGSKRSVLGHLLGRTPESFGRYFEPFAGSACLFFALRPRLATLGDLNGELIRCYRVLRRCPEDVWATASQMPQTETFYYELRAVDPSALHEVNRAARFVYLNRFCFNGVFRTNRRGVFNVPRGTHTGRIPSLEDFVAAARVLRRTRMRIGDFTATLRDVDKDDFVYLDPPYVTRRARQYGQYGYESLGPDGLARLIAEVRRIDEVGAKYVLSFSDSRVLKRNLPNASRRVIHVRRNVAGFADKRRIGREVVITNF